MTTYIRAQQDGLFFNSTKYSKRDRTVFVYERWSYDRDGRDDSYTLYGKINSDGELYVYGIGETVYDNEDESASYCIVHPKDIAGLYDYLDSFLQEGDAAFIVYDKDGKDVYRENNLPEFKMFEKALSGETFKYPAVDKPYVHWCMWHTGQRESSSLRNYLAYQGDFAW